MLQLQYAIYRTRAHTSDCMKTETRTIDQLSASTSSALGQSGKAHQLYAENWQWIKHNQYDTMSAASFLQASEFFGRSKFRNTWATEVQQGSLLRVQWKHLRQWRCHVTSINIASSMPWILPNLHYAPLGRQLLCRWFTSLMTLLAGLLLDFSTPAYKEAQPRKKKKKKKKKKQPSMHTAVPLGASTPHLPHAVKKLTGTPTHAERKQRILRSLRLLDYQSLQTIWTYQTLRGATTQIIRYLSKNQNYGSWSERRHSKQN